MKSFYKKSALTLAILSASASYSAIADEAKAVEYNVSAQPLAAAIKVFSKQSGLQIGYDTALAKGIKSSGISNATSLEAALDNLLSGTGLTYEFINENTVLLKTAEESEQGGGQDASDDVDEEVVVTGSRLRGVETAAPTVSITREDIERRGFSSVEDIIRSLPQNYAGINSSSHADFSSPGPRFINGASSANLRGLGTGSTLVLVNGRRSANAPSEDGTFIDLSKYPVGMIERVDVTTGGASAVYGSDAVGGVINIITRKDYQGAETTLRYESSNGDAYELRQMLGTNWDSGNVTVNLNYKQSDPVNRLSLGIENTDHSDRGGRDHRQRGITGVLDTRNGASIPGAPAGTRFAILPAGDGTNVQVSDLIYVSNLENATQTGNYLLMPLADVNLQNWLTSEQEDKSFNLEANQELTDSVQLYVDASYSKREGSTVRNAVRTSVLVPESNAYNNFGMDVSAAYDTSTESALGVTPALTTDTEAENYGFGFGLNFDLPWGDWSGEFDARTAVSKNDDVNLNMTISPLFDRPTIPAEVIAARDVALASSDPDTAINAFGDGTAQGSQVDFSQFIYDEGNGLRESELKSVVLNFNGSLFDLPGGTVSASFGAEIREESLDYSAFRLNTFAEQPTRDLEAFFAELNVPVVSESNALPLVEELSLRFAGRDDSYTIEGPFGDPIPGSMGPFGLPVNATEEREFSAFSPQVSLIWRPVDELRVSVDWSESFQAPTIQELFDPNRENPFPFFFDPLAPGGPGFVTALFGGGGNPNLQPQESTSTTIQFIYTPEAIPGLSVSVARVEIEFENVIRPGIGAFSSFPELLANYEQHPGVERDSDGNLVRVSFSPINAAFQRTEGVDFDISYDFSTDLGEFNVSLLGTYTGEFTEQLTPDTNPFTTDGKSQGLDTWTVIPSVQWNKEEWSANAYVNYSSSYELNDPDSPQFRVGSHTTVDAQVQYQLDDGSRLALGARNLFDADAPFHDSNLGLSATRYDVRGRIWYLDFKKEFSF